MPLQIAGSKENHARGKSIRHRWKAKFMGRHHLQRVVGVTRGSTLIWRGSVQVGPRHSTVAYQLGKEHFLDEGKNEGVCEVGRGCRSLRVNFRVLVACMMEEPS